MTSKIYLIQDKDIHSFDGSISGVAKKMLLNILPYTLFSPTITLYVEFLDADNRQLAMPFNKTIPTPEDWGTDDTIVIDAALAALQVTLLEDQSGVNPLPPAPAAPIIEESGE